MINNFTKELEKEKEILKNLNSQSLNVIENDKKVEKDFLQCKEMIYQIFRDYAKFSLKIMSIFSLIQTF